MARQPASAFRTIPLVREQLQRACEAAARDWRAELELELDSQLEHNVDVQTFNDDLAFDSPLEAAFWVWWLAQREIDPPFTGRCLDMKRHVEVMAGGDRYVLDFVVEFNGADSRIARGETAAYVRAHWPLIAIELDGHTFHEKTKEQVTYRNRRDRALQQAGWTVAHFSFDEFTRDPEGCILEPLNVAFREAMRLAIEHRKLTTPAQPVEAL